MLWKLFSAFLRVGALTIGGGLAMLPVVKAEVVDRGGWVSDEEFYDMVCLSQSFPGLIAVNMAVMVGYRVAGAAGSLLCVLGVIAAPFLIIILLASQLPRFIGHPAVARFMNGAMAGVAAVISGVIIGMIVRAAGRKAGAVLTALFLAAALLVDRVIWIIAAAILLGLTAHYLPGIGALIGIVDEQGPPRGDLEE